MFEHDIAKRLKVLGWALHGAGLAAVLAVAAAGYALAVRPLAAWTADCEARSSDLEERLADADALHAEQERLKRIAAEIDDRAARLARRVPDEPLEAEFLSQVTAAAAQAGLKLGDYRPGVVSVREGHSRMEIQVSCAGPYRSLCQFLDRMASLDRLSRVVQMDIAAGAEGCSGKITLVVFFHLVRPASVKAPAQGGQAHG